MQGLIILQMLGLWVATAAAMVAIRSIVISGLLCFLSGLVIAIASFVHVRPIGYAFGMSAPTMSVVCFTLICGLELTPDKAHIPIASLLVLFALFHTRGAVRALAELHRLKSPATTVPPLQFSLVLPLVLMVAVAMGFAVAWTRNEQLWAVGVLVGYLAAAGWLTRQFRRRQEVARPSPY